jgi:hypothetical protein
MMVARVDVDSSDDAIVEKEVCDIEGAFYAVAGASLKLILAIDGSHFINVSPDSVRGLSL